MQDQENKSPVDHLLSPSLLRSPEKNTIVTTSTTQNSSAAIKSRRRLKKIAWYKTHCQKSQDFNLEVVIALKQNIKVNPVIAIPWNYMILLTSTVIKSIPPILFVHTNVCPDVLLHTHDQRVSDNSDSCTIMLGLRNCQLNWWFIQLQSNPNTGTWTQPKTISCSPHIGAGIKQMAAIPQRPCFSTRVSLCTWGDPISWPHYFQVHGSINVTDLQFLKPHHPAINSNMKTTKQSKWETI